MERTVPVFSGPPLPRARGRPEVRLGGGGPRGAGVEPPESPLGALGGGEEHG